MTPRGFGQFLDVGELQIGGVFVVLALVALAVSRQERRHVLRLVAIYLVSLLLHGASAVAEAAGLPGPAAVGHLVATFARGIAIISLAGALFFGSVLPLLHLRPSKILRDVSVAIGSIAFFLWLLSTRHADVAGLVATSAVLTAVLGLSLQDFLTNVMGGLAIQLDRSVNVGDWIRFGETTGVVRDLTWRTTAVETLNGDTLCIPNNQLMRGPVLVLGRSAGGGALQDRRWVRFHVDNRVPPTVVLTAVTNALRREPIPGVSK